MGRKGSVFLTPPKIFTAEATFFLNTKTQRRTHYFLTAEAAKKNAKNTKEILIVLVFNAVRCYAR